MVLGKPRFYFTDVFGTDKYSGNQLATFINCGALSADEMQKIAREINFSETTFVTAMDGGNTRNAGAVSSATARDGGNTRNAGAVSSTTSDTLTDDAYDVRIFTPKEEIEFAGHPSLGSAHVIREKIIKRPVDRVTLNLKIGKIVVSFSNNNSGLLHMQQPEPRFGKTLTAPPMATTLGLSVDDIHADYPILEVSTGFPHIIVPLRTLEALKRIKINRDKYYALVEDGWAKIILVFVNQPYTKDQALAVRVFADYYGVSEDAATGSGNGGLAAYLVHTRYFGSTEIDIAVGQGYEMGRPSQLLLHAYAHAGGIKVSVGGRVVDIAEGVWG